ncbi:MAG: hypothetical protein ACLTLI_06115 [Clostridia bacterium]
MSDKKKIVLTALITAVVTAFISVNLTSFVKDRIAIYLPSKDENKAFSNKMTAVENMLSSTICMILTKQNFEMMRLKHMLTDLTSRIRITTLKASFLHI